MNAKCWRIRLGAEAEADFVAALTFSKKTFGRRQAEAYAMVILEALDALQDGPMLAGSAARDEIFPGLRTLHVARRGRRGRHVILYRAAADEGVVDVLRILHDAMDFGRHLSSI